MDPEVIIKHLRDKHGAGSLVGVKRSTTEVAASWIASNKRGLKLASWTPKLIDAFGLTFLSYFVAIETGDQERYAAWVQCCAAKKISSTFNYEVSVKGHGRTLMFGGWPRPINQPATDVIKSKDCLMIDRSFANFISCSEGNDCGLKLDLLVVIRSK